MTHTTVLDTPLRSYMPPPGFQTGTYITSDGQENICGVARPAGRIYFKQPHYVGCGRHTLEQFEILGDIVRRGGEGHLMEWYNRKTDIKEGRITPRGGHLAKHPKDLKSHYDQKLADSNVPVIASAHSMGGMILLRALHDHPELFDGFVMTSPMFQPRGGRTANWMARRMVELGYGDRPVCRDGSTIHQIRKFWDVARQKELPARMIINQGLERLDPNLTIQPNDPTTQWYLEAKALEKEVLNPEYLRDIKVPGIIFSATADDLVRPDAHRFAAQHMPNVKLVEFSTVQRPSGRQHPVRHNLFAEDDPIRLQVWNHISELYRNVLREFYPEDDLKPVFDHASTPHQTAPDIIQFPQSPPQTSRPPPVQQVQPAVA